MSEESAKVIKPSLHHVNIKTTRLQEMIDWYIAVVGAKVNFRFPGGAFLSNDRANHRIAFLTVPGLHEHPEKIAHTGLHHTAFEYENFDDLMSSYARLKQRHRTSGLPRPRTDHIALLRRSRSKSCGIAGR